MATKTSENAKQALLSYIHERLLKWAEWFMQDAPMGVGYPPCGIEHRLRTEGHFVREYQGLKPSPVNDEAQEIENLIKDMHFQNFQLAEVIRANYLSDDKIHIKARQAGLSQSQFSAHLTTARWWLISRLTLNKEIRELTRLFRKIRNES